MCSIYHFLYPGPSGETSSGMTPNPGSFQSAQLAEIFIPLRVCPVTHGRTPSLLLEINLKENAHAFDHGIENRSAP